MSELQGVLDFVPPREEITTEYDAGSAQNVMMHDGSWVKFRKTATDYGQRRPAEADGAVSIGDLVIW